MTRRGRLLVCMVLAVLLAWLHGLFLIGMGWHL